MSSRSTNEQYKPRRTNTCHDITTSAGSTLGSTVIREITLDGISPDIRRARPTSSPPSAAISSYIYNKSAPALF
jgi:hypothetical protein